MEGPDKKIQNKKSYEELQKENEILKDYIEWMKKQDIDTKPRRFMYIHLNRNILKSKHNYSLTKLCKLIKVSRDGYRKWVLRGCNIEPKYSDDWLKIIEKAFLDNKGNFGRPRLLFILSRDYKLNISEMTLYRYMNKLGIMCESKKYKSSKPPKELKLTTNGFRNLIANDWDVDGQTKNDP